MYKVFVNDIPIILSTEKVIGKRYKSIPIKSVKIKKLIKKLYNGEQLYINLYHPNDSFIIVIKRFFLYIAMGDGIYLRGRLKKKKV